MPQMAPISWLTLFFIFLFTYFLTMMKTYFLNNNLQPNQTELKSNSFMKLNWKW